MHLRRNVLIFHAGALGDFVLNWPLAMAMGRLYAQSRIIYVTHAQKGALAGEALGIESADMESGWPNLFREKTELPERPAKLLDGAQIIFSFVASPDDTWAQNVQRLAPEAGLHFLSPRPDSNYANHSSQHLLEQLQSQYVVHEAVAQMLRSLADRGLRRSAPRNEILIHPGSGSPTKCWPIDRFIELAARLKAAGRKVHFVLGEVELERWPAEQIQKLKAAAPIDQPKNYIDLWHILESAAAFVGNDSGPGHLAGVAGVPTVSLFGPTDPAVWKPLGPRAHVLRKDSLEQINVDEVVAAVNAVSE